MSTTIIYHQIKPGLDCPDGICAAWVVTRAVQGWGVVEEIEVIGDSYLNESEYGEGYQLPFDPLDKDVIIVDFSYPRSIMEGIADRAKSLTVLDHHKSRMGDLQSLSDRIRGGYSADDCGATFAWNFFYPSECYPDKPMPWFLPHVRNRDIGAGGYYEGEIPNSEAINTAISSRRQGLKGIEAFRVFDQLMSETEEVLIAEGMPAIKDRNKLVKEVLANYNGALLKVGEYLVPYYHITNYQAHRHYSIIGSVAARKHQESPFIAITTDDPLSISLRASKDSLVDVGEIAKSLGGGGHARAAGYKIVPEACDD